MESRPEIGDTARDGGHAIKRTLVSFWTALLHFHPLLLLLCILSGCPLFFGSKTGHTVSYDGNGSTGGSPPVDRSLHRIGDRVTVMDNTGILSRVGHGFAAWNTEPDGSGADRAAGTQFVMGQTALVLYARWIEARDGLSYVAVDSGYEVRKGSVESTGAMVIPEFWMGRPVVSIGDEAFADCASLGRVTIPGKVASIGDLAFRGCVRLVSVIVRPGSPPGDGNPAPLKPCPPDQSRLPTTTTSLRVALCLPTRNGTSRVMRLSCPETRELSGVRTAVSADGTRCPTPVASAMHRETFS
jgi:hypothetical protein